MKQIDPKKHSLVYLYLLLALISSRRNQKSLEFKQIQEHCDHFLTNFTYPQVTSAVSKLFQLVSCYAEYLISVDKAIYGIRSIRETIIKTRDSEEQISPLHREFAKLCLKAKCYMHSLSIIETPVTSFKQKTAPLDIIVYNYYRGLLFTGLTKYN